MEPDDFEEPVPEASPELQPTDGGEWGTKSETAVGAPTQGDDLLLRNRTQRGWTLDLGFRRLAVLAPREERVVRAARTGTITARQVDPAGQEYLVATLDPFVHGAEVYDVSGVEGYYALRLLYPTGPVEILPSATPIEELNLSARTENALKRAGWTTVGEVLVTPAEDLGRLQHIGDKSLREIIRRVRNIVVF